MARYDIAVSPDGRHIFFALGNRVVQWNIQIGEGSSFVLQENPISKEPKVFTRVVMAPDGSFLVAASSEDMILQLWEFPSGREVGVLRGHTDEISSLAITPDSGYIVSGSKDKTIIVWDCYKKKAVAMLTGHAGAITAVAITPDGDLCVSASTDTTLRLWKLPGRVRQDGGN